MLDIFLAGFLSGLFLNFMPCVLPVIAIKLTSVSGYRSARGLVFDAIGIVLSMLLFSLFFVFLKITGSSPSWGLHFQSSQFVCFLMFLMSLFILISKGDVVLRVPSFLTRLQGGVYSSGVLEGLLSGFLVVVFSSACLGPAMGMLLLYAFRFESAFAILVMFVALGFGVALPFFVASFAPNKVAEVLLSKKDRSIKVKNFSLSMMVATVLWILYVFYKQMDAVSAVVVFSLLCLGMVLSRRWSRVLPLFVACALALGSVHVQKGRIAEKAVVTGHLWNVFDESSLRRYITQGKVVMLYVTADWCLTCKFLSLTLFERSDFLSYAYGNYKRLVAMKADITKRDRGVRDFMRRHKYPGVPVVAVFSSNCPEGYVLHDVNYEMLSAYIDGELLAIDLQS